MSFDHRRFLSTVSESPGIYRMFDARGDTLYVGKARRLKARLASYFRGALNAKTQALVARIADIQVTVTNSETRSEEHTSELQSRPHLVCRLLLEKKKR